MTEQELVARARAGDQDAFAQLVRNNEKRVYNLALRMVGDPDDALDLSQETFLNAWRGLPGFKGDSAFSTWVYRLTSNACLDFLRAKKRRQEIVDPVHSLDDRDTPPPPADERLRPDAQLERKERSDSLHRALDDLPDHHRQILVMRELSGLSYQEISEVLRLDLGTVKSRLTRARTALRKLLLADGNFFTHSPSIPSEEPERKRK